MVLVERVERLGEEPVGLLAGSPLDDGAVRVDQHDERVGAESEGPRRGAVLVVDEGRDVAEPHVLDPL